MPPKPSRGGHGGAWRAYCHVHGRGEKYTAESLRRLAAEYRRLTPDEYKEYETLGRLATEAHAVGAGTFPAFSRTSRSVRGVQLQRSNQDELEEEVVREKVQETWLTAVQGRTLRASRAVPKKGDLYSAVREIARSLRQLKKLKRDSLSEGDSMTAETVIHTVNEIVERGFSGRQGLQTLPCTTAIGMPDRVPTVALDLTIAEAAREAFAQQTCSSLAEAWKHRHLGVCESSWPQAQARAPPRACHKRGHCCCRGIGRLHLKMFRRLESFLKQHSLNEEFQKSLCEGWFILEWIGESLEAPAKKRKTSSGRVEEEPSGVAVAVRLYTHIALQYLKPWRPTMVRVTPLLQELDDNYQAFECAVGDHGGFDIFTVWEWLAQLPLETQWNVVVWRLSSRARPCRPLTNILYAHQHMQDHCQVWCGREAEGDMPDRPPPEVHAMDDGGVRVQRVAEQPVQAFAEPAFPRGSDDIAQSESSEENESGADELGEALDVIRDAVQGDQPSSSPSRRTPPTAAHPPPLLQVLTQRMLQPGQQQLLLMTKVTCRIHSVHQEMHLPADSNLRRHVRGL